MASSLCKGLGLLACLAAGAPAEDGFSLLPSRSHVPVDTILATLAAAGDLDGDGDLDALGAPAETGGGLLWFTDAKATHLPALAYGGALLVAGLDGDKDLRGAKMALFSPDGIFDELASRIRRVPLSRLNGFQDIYFEEMIFPS